MRPIFFSLVLLVATAQATPAEVEVDDGEDVSNIAHAVRFEPCGYWEKKDGSFVCRTPASWIDVYQTYAVDKLVGNLSRKIASLEAKVAALEARERKAARKPKEQVVIIRQEPPLPKRTKTVAPAPVVSSPTAAVPAPPAPPTTPAAAPPTKAPPAPTVPVAPPKAP